MSAANGHGSSAGNSAHNGNGHQGPEHGWFCCCLFCMMQGTINSGR